MSTIENGGPAFPCEGEVYGKVGDPRWTPGMTLRDYFAAKAMQGFVAGDHTGEGSGMYSDSDEPMWKARR